MDRMVYQATDKTKEYKELQYYEPVLPVTFNEFW